MRRFKLKRFIILFLVIFFASISYAASFDCTKASTFIEKAICSESDLSKLDDLLEKAYKKALIETANKKKLTSDQRDWLFNIRNKCQDSNCIEKVYTERILTINKLTNNDNSFWPGVWNRVSISIHEGGELTITDVRSMNLILYLM